MSRRSGDHAKTAPGYEARHAKPGMPGPAALIGTAAKAVPASLVAGAAGSALALSGTASAAIHHPGTRSAYTVISGNTLSGISARFCGTTADYLSLAAASGITNPDIIYPGQHVKLDCHAHVPAALTAPPPAPEPPPPAHASGKHHRDHAAAHRHAVQHRRPGRHSRTSPRPSGHFSTEGMAAFESCVISRESGGNPRAVNASSGAGGLFQFLPSTWAGLGYADAYPGGAQTAPVGVQEAAFAKLFAEAGTSPWRPYDGC